MFINKINWTFHSVLWVTLGLLAPSLVEAQALTAFDGFESGDLSYAATDSNGKVFFKWRGGSYTRVSDIKAKTGKYSLRFNYVPNSEGTDSWAEQDFVMPDVKATVYEFSYDLYIPSNFTQRVQPNNGSNNKFFMTWSGSYGTKASLQSVAFEYWPVEKLGVEGISQTIIDNNPGSSILDYHVGPGHTDWGHTWPTDKLIIGPGDAGKWMHIDIYIKLASADNSSNGEIKVTKNGNIYYDVKNLADYSNIGNFLDHGYILGWANSGFAQQTVLYVDNFKVTLSGFPPSTPTLHIQN